MHRLILLSVIAVAALGSLPCRAEGEDAPFDHPLTPEEGRYLLDRADEKRWQIHPQEKPSAQPVQLQMHPETLSPELKQIQRALGGSVVDQVVPPQGPSETVTVSTPAAPESRVQEKIDALRDAAWQLDAAAHQLELLDLFRQADALREQARQLRLDARSMIQGQENQRATAPLPTPVDSTVPN